MTATSSIKTKQDEYHEALKDRVQRAVDIANIFDIGLGPSERLETFENYRRLHRHQREMKLLKKNSNGGTLVCKLATAKA